MLRGTGNAALRFNDGAPAIYTVNASTAAVVDGSIDLGASAARFKDFFLSGEVALTGGKSTYTDFETLLNATSINDAFPSFSVAVTGNGLGTIFGSNVSIDGSTFSQPNSQRSTGYFQIDNTTTASKTSLLRYQGFVKGSTTPVERFRMDFDGNFMVGQSTGTIYNQTSETGLTVAGSGSVQATTSAGTTLFLNRLSSDGQIVGFYKDGAQVGSIGTTAGDIQIGSGDTALRFQASTDSVFPAQASGGGRGSAIDLGLDSVPFKDLYLSGDTFVGEPSTIGAGETGVTVRGLGQIRVGRSGTSSATLISFNNGNGEVGTITTSGSATAYNTSSDQRLKENIVDAPSASDDIDAIQVRSFDWKADGSHQKYGMIAQELQTVAPEAVSQPEDPEEMMGVDYSKLVPIMLKEIQQLRARVAQLEGAN